MDILTRENKFRKVNGLATHSLARPRGTRSCANDVNREAPSEVFEWVSVEDFDQKAYAEAMKDDFHSRFSNSARATAWARFTDKLERATKGDLRFGSGNRKDVDYMRCTSDVLELKWSNLPPDSEEQGMWLRLYFSEPVGLPGTLLRLNLQLKYKNSPTEQDADALCAQQRLEKHFS